MDKKQEVRFAIDLTWLREREIGGIESFTRNLLDSLSATTDDFTICLMTSVDNHASFEHYEQQDNRFEVIKCNLDSHNIPKRVLWQNFCLPKELRRLEISKCYVPYYCKPVIPTCGIKFAVTVHDLQALHYPEYFSFGKRTWYRFAWWVSMKTSAQIATISQYVRDDVLENYRVNDKKIHVIYNPIIIDQNEILPFEEIRQKYGIEDGEYYFTVSSLLPHKNVVTLVKTMAEIQKQDLPIPRKLLVSGVGGSTRPVLEQMIADLGLQNNVIITPYIENSERNALYKHCCAFLMPSLFEGFGMPPIEAMLLGAPVISTKKASLYEVTCGKVTYVEDPLSTDEWIEKMMSHPKTVEDFDFSIYAKEHIAEQYLNFFRTFCQG